MKNSNKERGVALLYVLGILALLMTMGLAFVSSSLFDQKAASNNAAATELADKLAASTLERLLHGIQNYDSDPGIDFSYMPDDHYGTSTNKISKDGLEALETYDVINGKDKAYIFEWNASHNEEIRDKIRWILHRVNAGTDPLGNPIKKVIGRSAFVLIKLSEGKVNPLYLVKAGVTEEAIPNPEKRRGVEVNEINLQSLNSTIFVPNFVKYMNIDDGLGGNDGIQPGGGWVDYTAFINAMESVVTIPKAQRDIMNDLFVFTSGVSSEEFFWMDMNKDGKITDNEKFHRFHLPNFIDADDDYISTTDTNEFSVDRNRWERTDFEIDRDILMVPANDGTVTLDLTDIAAPWRQYDSAHSPPTPPLTKSVVDAAGMAVFGTGIPWLAGFGYDKAGVLDDTLKATFGTVLDRRRQIAANLKDYCDTDDVPTSDVLPSTWTVGDTPVRPTYTGNELTPYLDAVEAKVSIEGGWMAETAYCELKVDIDAQLINIYKQLIGNYKTAKIKIGYTLAYDIELKVSNNANPDPAPLTSDGTTVKTVEIEIDTTTWPGSGSKAYHSFMNYKPLITVPAEGRLDCLYQQPAFTPPDPPPDPPLASFSVKNVRLTITNVMLEYGGQNVDYAKIDKAATASVPDFIHTDIAKTGLTSHDYFALLSWQTNDPRQNLNPGDWEANSIIGLTSADCVTQSILVPGNKKFGGIGISPANPPGTVAGEFDPEIVTDPATDGTNQMSTAYIRNAPMLSPWELGFIHRGQAWQTLNLKNYDREKAITSITSGSIQILPGGGLYSKGDANILDQVKMTIDAKSKDKKINLKAQGKRSKEILSALFHVKTGANLSNSVLVSKDAVSSGIDAFLDEVAGGTPVLDADRDSIAKNIQDRSPGLLTRAGIAEEESLRKGATDAEQEEIIGKMINLTELSEDLEFFELIILSQAIKDVGNYNDVTGSIPIYFYNGATKTTDDIPAKVGEINFAEADGKHRIADEITAQRKIRVRGYRRPDPDNSVQLISIKQSE